MSGADQSFSTWNTLVITKLDRLARPPPDARDIVGELTNGTAAVPSHGRC
ncbi:MAG: hypothetical protein ABSF03_10105 [Streptosporangiaceae bacterium]